MSKKEEIVAKEGEKKRCRREYQIQTICIQIQNYT